ncbi:hypothetical protein V6N13_046586 [Hibiscus sabdariffa]
MMAGEIIAKTSFGLSNRNGSIGNRVFEKLRAMQDTLFNDTNRYAGVPFNKWLCLKKTLADNRLGKEIDQLLLSIIDARKSCRDGSSPQNDLLSLMMNGDVQAGLSLTTRELIDECKTFFFSGYETTALALTWTMLLLAMYPDWQNQLRDEIRQVFGDGQIDFEKLTNLIKMEWVLKEVLRLYSPAPNTQRQTREDIKVDDVVIPNGTSIWIDIVAMHNDPMIWGDDVYDFRPDRFKDDSLYGGCKHKMGYLPFGFGGKMCVGRNLTMIEYKRKRDVALRKMKVKSHEDLEAEIDGRSLSDSDIKAAWSRHSKDSWKTLKLGKKLGIQFFGNEEEVLKEISSLERCECQSKEF